jgi:predicted nucleic acid-binding protein
MARAETYVFDATPLIYLTKAELIDPLSRLPNPFLTSPRVKDEVLEAGRRKGAAEVLTLERLLSEGRLRVRPLRSQRMLARLREDPRLSDADREAVALAAETRGRLIADEAPLRSIAQVLDLPVGGSIFLLGRLVEMGFLSRAEARAALDRIVAAGWYCSPALYRSVAALFG